MPYSIVLNLLIIRMIAIILCRMSLVFEIPLLFSILIRYFLSFISLRFTIQNVTNRKQIRNFLQKKQLTMNVVSKLIQMLLGG